MYKRKESPDYVENNERNTRKHDAVMLKTTKANHTCEAE